MTSNIKRFSKKVQPVDRIFALIEKHRAAERQCVAFSDKLEKYSWDQGRGPRVYHCDFISGGKRTPVYFHSVAEIRREVRELQNFHIETYRNAGGPEAKGREWIAAFKADQKAVKLAQEKSGYAKAKRDYDRACDEAFAAYRAVLTCKPTTSAGISALASHVAKFEKGMDDDFAVQALLTIAKAAA